MAFVTLKHHGFPSSFPPNSPSPNSCRLAMIATLLILRPVHLPHTTHIQSDVTSRLRAGPRLLFPFILASPRYPISQYQKKYKHQHLCSCALLDLSPTLPTPALTKPKHISPGGIPNVTSSHSIPQPRLPLSIRNWRTQTPDPRDARQTRPEGDSRIYPHPAHPRVPVQVPTDRRAPNSTHVRTRTYMARL